MDHDRAYVIRHLIMEHVQSPSIRHIRDTKAINALVERIATAVDTQPSVWTKWVGLRDELIRAAAPTWVPIEDLRDTLNAFPGPRLTRTDVVQRLRAIHEEPYSRYPNEDLKEGCLALYERERAEGTEFTAIVGALQEFVEAETERLRQGQGAESKRKRDEERQVLEALFLAGADCGWTPVQGSAALYIRKNGRAYRLAPTKDKRLDLWRIKDAADKGALVGTYRTRGDAVKALKVLAYQPEPRW